MILDRQRVLIDRLTEPSLSELQVCGAIRELIQFRDQKSQNAIEDQLNSESAVVRYTALSVLVFEWGLPEHQHTAIRFLLSDPDEDNRSMGAGCLGSLLRGSHNADVLRVLLQAFLSEEEAFIVKSSAYHAILDVLGEPRSRHHTSLKPERFEQQIDWGIVARLKDDLNL